MFSLWVVMGILLIVGTISFIVDDAKCQKWKAEEELKELRRCRSCKKCHYHGGGRERE